MTSARHKRTVLVIALLLVFTVAAFIFSSQFLLYSEEPARCDAIILLVGPVMKARRQFAQKLQADGYGNFLLIPAYGKALDNEGRRISWDKGDFLLQDKDNLHGKCESIEKEPGLSTFMCRYMENTHREVVRARQMVNALGIRSVNIVSSPYHTRRLKIIFERVFKNTRCELHFVATPLGPQPSLLWFKDRNQRWWVINEWAKMLWFYVYSPFCRI